MMATAGDGRRAGRGGRSERGAASGCAGGQGQAAEGARGGRVAAGAGRGRGDGTGGGRGAGGPGLRRNRNRQGGRDRVLFRQSMPARGPLERVVVCVDDTDDVSGDTSTGHVAELIADEALALGGRVELGISRHQLLLAEGVPYTSHNSAMAFTVLLPAGVLEELRERAVAVLGRACAPTADPGLCMGALPQEGLDAAAQERLSRQLGALVAFGQRAQQLICTKGQAYELAAQVPWLRLSEHGGTGQGAIGALAGAGLRLGGFDGRFRGLWEVGDLLGAGCGNGAGGGGSGGARERLAAGELRAALEPLVGGRVLVVGADGVPVPDGDAVLLGAPAKPVLREGALCFVADASEGGWRLVGDGSAGDLRAALVSDQGCEGFSPDNDPEECAFMPPGTCGCCLHRRWTAEGFSCMRQDERRTA